MPGLTAAVPKSGVLGDIWAYQFFTSHQGLMWSAHFLKVAAMGQADRVAGRTENIHVCSQALPGLLPAEWLL